MAPQWQMPSIFMAGVPWLPVQREFSPKAGGFETRPYMFLDAAC
jgi:hypothetical protein